MTQRREPIRSRKYLDGSRGQPCALQITGACTGDADTTVAAHIRDETFGGGQKADDISVADACWGCHRVFDGHSHTPLTSEEWHFYALRGLQRTFRNRVLRGIAVIALDVAKPGSERPTPPRKPKAERAAITQRKDAWPKGQKIASRNTLRRKEPT